jgi:hypothetical protein
MDAESFITGRSSFIQRIFSNEGLRGQWAQRAARLADIVGRAEPPPPPPQLYRQGTGIGIGNRDSKLADFSWAARGQKEFKTHKEKCAFQKHR